MTASPNDAGIRDDVALFRLLDRLEAWVAHDGHWIVLGGDRRTAKTAILAWLAVRSQEVECPFVFSEWSQGGGISLGTGSLTAPGSSGCSTNGTITHCLSARPCPRISNAAWSP